MKIMAKIVYTVVFGLVALFTMNSCLSDQADEMDDVNKEEVLLSLSRGGDSTSLEVEKLKNIRFYFFKEIVQDSVGKYVFSEVVDFISEDEVTGISLEKGKYRVVVFANYSEADFAVSDLKKGETVLEEVRIRLKDGRKIPELLKGEEVFVIGEQSISLNVSLSRKMISKVQFCVTTRPQNVEQVKMRLKIPLTVFDLWGQMYSGEEGCEEEIDLVYVEEEQCFKSNPMFLFFTDELNVVFYVQTNDKEYVIEHTRRSALLTEHFIKINSTVSLVDQVVVQDVMLGEWNDQGVTNLDSPLFSLTYRSHPDAKYFLSHVFLRDEKSGRIVAFEQIKREELGDNRWRITTVYPWDGEFTIVGLGVSSLYVNRVIDFPEDLRITLPEDKAYVLNDSIIIHSEYGIGEGTEERPFLVYSANSLSHVGGLGYYFKQIHDIQLIPNVFDENIMYWNYNKLYYNISLENTSVYDGNGHVIRVGENFDNKWLFGRVSGKIINCGIEGAGTSDAVLLRYLSESAVVENCYSKSEEGVVKLVDESNEGTVRNCYVMGKPDEKFPGVFGSLNATSQIINSYAILETSPVVDSLKLGYCLARQNGEVLNMLHCYYDKDLCVYKAVFQENTNLFVDIVDKAEGKTSSEMKVQATFKGWKFGNDYTNPWKINPEVNNGYPYLYWEK